VVQVVKILLLSRFGQDGASSRLRFHQYVPYLRSLGWTISVAPLFSDKYLDKSYSGKPVFFEYIRAFFSRIIKLLTVKKYDLIWLEGEVFPFLPAFAIYYFKMIGVPYVVDYDDALFHRYDDHNKKIIRGLLGKKIDYVMRNASLVIVGNDYLYQHAASTGAKKIKVIPTVIDFNRYMHAKKQSNQKLVIGWIGTPRTAKYLFELREVITVIKSKFDVNFVGVGVKQEDVAGLEIEARPWSEESEVQSILEFDIGIMPLKDNAFAQGKCGYKLIQYMACGIPVIASPVGVNTSIVEDGTNGFLAETTDGWICSLKSLLSKPDLRLQMGNLGRKKVIAEYTLETTRTQLVSLLRGSL
jgi:glycosyltransferase involved in cell wall biosynthesis